RGDRAGSRWRRVCRFGRGMEGGLPRLRGVPAVRSSAGSLWWGGNGSMEIRDLPWRTEQLGDFWKKPFPRGFVFQGAGPDGDDVPAEFVQGGFGAEVAGPVAGDFGFPPIGAGGGEAEVGAMFVAVPEAAVDEDDRAAFRQDDVG